MKGNDCGGGGEKKQKTKKTENRSTKFLHFENCSEILHVIIFTLFIFKYQASKENRVWERYADVPSGNTKARAIE